MWFNYWPVMDLDELVLSGALFSNPRSTSPVRSPPQSRSPSPDPLFPSNEDLSDPEFSSLPPGVADNDEAVELSTANIRGNGTGVKSVIRDRDEAVRRENEKRAREIKETNRRMEKMALTARTYAEEEEERLHEKAIAEGLDKRDMTDKRMLERKGRFGHLREVSEGGFLDAIEGEATGTYIVLHIYHPTSSRSHGLDAILARLAREYPETKFLRARAAAVGFATSSRPRPAPSTRSNLITISEDEVYSNDEDDPYFYDDDEEEEEYELEDVTDADMFPTMLVYQSGELKHNWVRVDWEAESWVKRKEGDSGSNSTSIEALLRGHNIIRPASNGNCGFSSDDDDSGEAENDDDLFDL
ncbi:thioredoxin-like protein [Hysterangium stoloniferum]|nr:thioredoxin-like protein [Hysterangium stoloniferum]